MHVAAHHHCSCSTLCGWVGVERNMVVYQGFIWEFLFEREELYLESLTTPTFVGTLYWQFSTTLGY